MVSGSTGNSPQSPNFGLFWALVPDKMGETARIGGGDLRGGVKKNSKIANFLLQTPSHGFRSNLKTIKFAPFLFKIGHFPPNMNVCFWCEMTVFEKTF